MQKWITGTRPEKYAFEVTYVCATIKANYFLSNQPVAQLTCGAIAALYKYKHLHYDH